MWGMGVPDDVKTFMANYLSWDQAKIDAWEAEEKKVPADTDTAV